MSLALVVPGLLALPPEALSRCAPLATLARLGEVEIVADGIEAATLRALGLDAAIAPLVARGAGLATGDDGWLCADPVVLVAGREDVRLVGRVDDLTREESDALRARLDRHFADDGLAFEVPRPDRWLVRVRNRALPQTSPLARAQRTALRGLLPAGDGAAAWLRWQNEIQMLLHDDPVNAAREARGKAPVSGIWFWGGGRASPLAQSHDAAAVEGRDGDLVRGIVRTEGSDAIALPATLPSPWLRQFSAAALPAPADAASLVALTEGWLAPAIACVERGDVRSLALACDAGGAAAVWRMRRPGMLARLRARWSPAPFAVPPGIVHDDATGR
jgi:hypothetical protein